MAVYFINYADKSFKVRQRLSISAAKKCDVLKIISYSEDQIKQTDFYARNKKILDQSRGSGFWLWKPYIIYETLKKIQDNEIVVYADSGGKLISSIKPLIDICDSNESGLVIFDSEPVPLKWYTKRDVFAALNIDSEKYWNSFQVMGGFLLIKKTNYTLQFVKEWLELCEDEQLLTDLPSKDGLGQLEEFVEHRHDQAILGALVAKKNIHTYRNPTKHGDYLKMKEFRSHFDQVIYPFYLRNIKMKYSDTPRMDSPYPTIYQSFPRDFEKLSARILFQFVRIKNKIFTLTNRG